MMCSYADVYIYMCVCMIYTYLYTNRPQVTSLVMGWPFPYPFYMHYLGDGFNPSEKY